MNQPKLKILEETFAQEFNLDRFKKFTKEFFNEPELMRGVRSTAIWKEYLNYVKSFYEIARYTDSNNNKMLVLAVELQKDSSIDRARSMQRNFIAKILDENGLEAAIVAFYTEDNPDWRLSLVRLDYSFKETGLSLDLTPAKRYSYLLGKNEPNITARAQLLTIFADDKHNPTLDTIEQAFSVEKVTKDFFNLYSEKYFNLKEELEKDAGFIRETEKLGLQVDKFAEQFAKKLMGQLAFLYFLQKKGWLGVRIIPENHILSLAEYQAIYVKQDDIHKKILEKAFLPNKDNTRRLSASVLFSLDSHEAGLLSDCFTKTTYDMAWGSGNKSFVREIFNFCTTKTTKNFFNEYLEPFFYEALNNNRKNHYYNRFNCKIPFLNGGLFEPLEGYHWDEVEFKIPNEIFSNLEEKGREADGILDIFDRFNFTINEDEPLEKEVAVDPEMLGKIFENLLDLKDRKSKGAYYTPREIVHYMCQESLINYLVNEVNVPYDDMKEFILYGEIIRDADNRTGVGYRKGLTIKPSIYDNIQPIDKALKNVKVADPAVGSGAFPLGMLNEIIRARNNITEYIIRKDKEGYFDQTFGEEFIRKRRDSYQMKLDTIKDSIFAVDIEPSAVDIAKLRLWLSVVVEQEINAENPEPHTLPNLDMNIQVGNSLIDEYEGIKLFDKSILTKDKISANEPGKVSQVEQLSLLIDHTDEILQDMFNLQERYFAENDENKKKEIKTKIDEIRCELIRYKLRQDNNTEALARYEELLKNRTRPYFIWELEFAKIFKEKGGFDIVIGNPPYVDSEMMTKTTPQLREIYTQIFDSARGNWDLFVIFIEKGLRLLANKGHISFIVPNKLISAKYTETLRKILLSCSIKEFRDYSSVKVFAEADVYPVVFVIGRQPSEENIKMTVMETILQPRLVNEINNEVFYADIYWDKYFATDSVGIGLIQKILQLPKLGEIATVLGAATVNEAYKFKEVVLEHEHAKTLEPIKKFINSGTIDRYLSLWGIKNMTYIKGSYKKPVILEKDIEAVSLTRFKQAQSEKIIIAGMTKYLECFYDEGNYLAAKSTVIVLKKDNDIDLEYLTGLLNSKLITFFFNNFFSSLSLAGGYLRIGAPQIKEIPIAINSLTAQNEIINHVKSINTLISEQDYNNSNAGQKIVANIEQKIDERVYEIYNLTPEEIEVVENFRN